MIKLQYQGLSLLDQIETVEIAYDEQQGTIHLYDEERVIWPEYRGLQNGYVLSDGFDNMIKVLRSKPIFKNNAEQNDSEWLRNFAWCFYRKNALVLILEQGTEKIHHVNQNFELNENFVNR